MTRKLPSGDIWARYQGVWRYLQTEESSRKTQFPNPSQMNSRARDLAKRAIEYLILFSENQVEREVAKVMEPRAVRALVKALVGTGSPQLTKRHYAIAKEVIPAAVRTFREMLADDRYALMINPTMETAKNSLLQLPSPSFDSKSNPGYEQEREWIAKDLKPLKT